MPASKACVAVAAVLLAVAGVRASINGNPDSWELPPAAPNYYYNAQGLLGEGPLATLVTIRDPLQTDVAYNTSLFAFSVSGGLVPLNYLQLSDGHCRSYVVADVLVCDFQSSASGITILYQLGVNPGTGGANRLVIVDQVSVPTPGSLAGNALPVYVPATGHIVALQYASAGVYTVYDIQRNASDGSALSVEAVGTVDLTHARSLYVSDDATELTISSDEGLSTYSYPSLELLRQNNAALAGAYVLGITGAATEDFGFALSSASSSAITYQPMDFYSGSTVGSAFTDKTTSMYSSGLYTATSGSAFGGGVGPCVYVQGYATEQSKTQYGIISQVRVPTNAGAAFTIEAQLPLVTNVADTMVANSGYLFIVSQEIMYRYIASC